MEQCILTIGTVTRAIRARKLLLAAHIAARLIKQVGKARSGCAYGLEIAAQDLQPALRILGEHGIEAEWSRGKATGNR